MRVRAHDRWPSFTATMAALHARIGGSRRDMRDERRSLGPGSVLRAQAFSCGHARTAFVHFHHATRRLFAPGCVGAPDSSGIR
ncbi:hypothetical protein WS91_09975 [Burkholderia sp. MSMB1498]|nr:hypothetical protein WS91_09975 [Burkholderia sp. MSMB1498]